MKILLAKLFGKYLENKAALYDGTPTNGRAWYKSKGVLSGIAIFLRGVYGGVSSIMVLSGQPALPPIPPIVDAFLLSALGTAAVKGRIDANLPITVGDGIDPKSQS